MRAYFFGNMYLSSIQQGIQAAHTVHELFTKYRHTITGEKTLMLYEWADNHKTMILLNAGYSSEIHSLGEMFEFRDNPYPWGFFQEGDDALDGATTCVGIILPQKIYETAERFRKGEEITDEFGINLLSNYVRVSGRCISKDEQETFKFNKWEFDLINRLNQYGLAR